MDPPGGDHTEGDANQAVQVARELEALLVERQEIVLQFEALDAGTWVPGGLERERARLETSAERLAADIVRLLDRLDELMRGRG